MLGIEKMGEKSVQNLIDAPVRKQRLRVLFMP